MARFLCVCFVFKWLMFQCNAVIHLRKTATINLKRQKKNVTHRRLSEILLEALTPNRSFSPLFVGEREKNVEKHRTNEPERKGKRRRERKKERKSQQFGYSASLNP